MHSIEQNPPIHQQGNSIRVENVDARNISIDYEITVPVETAVRAHSGSGDQILEGTHGNADIGTGSGDLKLAHLTGEVHVQTGPSGNVRAHGNFRASARWYRQRRRRNRRNRDRKGRPRTPHWLGQHHSARSAGRLPRRDGAAETLPRKATQTGSWDIHTGSGNVRVKLPGNAGFEADISTSSGTIDVGAPIQTTVHDRVGGDSCISRFAAKANGGGPLLRVRTGSGDIHIV